MRFALVCDTPRDAEVDGLARELSRGGQVVVVAPAVSRRRDEVVDGVRHLDVEVDTLVADSRTDWQRSAPSTGLPLLRPVPAAQDLMWRRDVATRSRGRIGLRERLIRDWYRGRRFLGRFGVRQHRRLRRWADRLPKTWRQQLPEVLDLDLALGAVLDILEPDVVLGWGIGTLPTVSWSGERARAAGREVTCAVAPRGPVRGAVQAMARAFRSTPLLATNDEVAAFIARWPRATAAAWDVGHGRRLGIGVTNSAGQGWEWARAAAAADSSLTTEVWALQNPTFNYPADVRIPRPVYAQDVSWGLARREYAMQRWSHALFESGRPLFGSMNGGDPRPDIRALESAGVKVGLVFHGSDIRDPARHAATHRYSPFADPTRRNTPAIQAACDRNRRLVEEAGLPVFVSTPDLLEYVPGATWLPVVVDVERLVLREKPRRSRPLVVHAPSNPWLKGTSEIEAALEGFAGVIDYRRVENLAPEEALELIAEADVVIDQVLLGLYGVLACEALATGSVVLGHLGDRLRTAVPAEVPILEVTPDDLAERMTEVLDRLPELAGDTQRRRDYVLDFHDGRRSAGALSEFLRD